MKTQWLFEDHIFTENVEKMKLAIKKQGMIFKSYEYKPFTNPENINLLFGATDNVVFYGSLQCSKRVYAYTSWIPGTFCTLENYECLRYYSILGEYHINNDYFMLPASDLVRQKELVFQTFGNSNTVFIRPSSGFKSFTGTPVFYEQWEGDVDFLTNNIPSDTLIIVSSPKNISNEWRLVICDGEIITSSQYRDKNGLCSVANTPKEVIDFGNKVLNDTKISPDPVFCLDICETENKLKVMEINSFSSAGLYECDLDIVVERVSATAEKLYEDYML